MWALRLVVADASVLLGSFLGAYALRVALDNPLARNAGPLSYYLWLLGLIVPVWIVLLAAFGGYGLGWMARSRAWLVARVSGIGLVLLTAALSGGGLAGPRLPERGSGRRGARRRRGSGYRDSPGPSRSAPGGCGRRRGLLRGPGRSPRSAQRRPGGLREPRRRRACAGRPLPARPRSLVRGRAVRPAVLRCLPDPYAPGRTGSQAWDRRRRRRAHS